MNEGLAPEASTSHDPTVPGRIYSVGYEGFKAQGLADRLAASGVSAVVDVRLTPVSRKVGFSRKALEATLSAVGIEYVHEGGLGNPQENRDAFRHGSTEEGRERMREVIDNGSRDALDRLVERARNRRIAVLCVERDPRRCHRDVITEMVEEADPTIEIRHIL